MAKIITGKIRATACTLEYKWIIDYDCLSDKNVGEVLKSPVFKTVNIGSNKFCQWQLELYPNGTKKDYENFVSIYLCLLNGPDEFELLLSFEIFDNKGELVQKKKSVSGRVNSTSRLNNLGTSRFVNRNFIKKNQTSSGDELTIVCEINVLEKKEQQNILRVDDNYGNHRQLIDDFKRLMNDKEFSDITFKIGDEELHAHKIVMSIRSPVFAAMFRNEMKEKHENKVEITDIRREVFQEILRYIYTEKVNGIDKIASELLVASDKYSLNGLMLMCEKSLSSNIKVDNVLENLSLAELHSVGGLKAKCIEFIVTKAVDIVKNPEFRQLLSFDIICDVCSALADKTKQNAL